MRVLFCHDGPLRVDEEGNYYGVSHTTSSLSRYNSIGNEISIAIRVNSVAKQDAQMGLSEIKLANLSVVPCPNMSSPKGLFFKKKDAKRIIEEEVIKADFLVARLPSMIGFIAIDKAKKHNKPYLIELVACPWDAFWNHSIVGKLVAPVMYLKTKSRVKNSKYVVYVTNKFLQNRYPTNGVSTNCSNVSLEQVNEEHLINRIENIKNLTNKNRIIIGTTAAINVKYKGQQFVIKALGKLKKQGITNFEYHLVGAGDNSYLKSIAKKYDVEDQVVFLGSKPHNEIFNWLDEIDLYAQPSLQEGLPRALIEAMSRGLPAFGSNTAGIPELINPEFTFNRNGNKVNEICEILENLDEEKLVIQAKANFLEAKKYEKITIDNRRELFFQKFVQENS